LSPNATEDGTRVLAVRNKACLTVTISRPERRNPIGTAAAGKLVEVLEAALADPEVRVVVLTGEGEHFSSGGDLKEFLTTTSEPPAAHWASGATWGALFRTLQTYPKPTICRVRGAAFAGGCGLVAACDFAIAEQGAKFAVPEAKIGLFPLFILPALIRAVGRRNALDLALTARTIDAEEALEMGLLSRLVPAEGLDDAVETLAEQLSGIGPLTMAMGKRAFNHIAELDLGRALEAARDMRVPFMTSPELKSGIESFLEKKRKGEDVPAKSLAQAKLRSP